MNPIIDNFKSVYDKLDASNISLVQSIYAYDVIFIDPFHQIQGLTNLNQYFAGLYQNVESCQFTFGEVYSKATSAMITWNMAFKHRRLSKQLIEVSGSTHICFDEKIHFQRDYFDAGKMLYEHIPAIGAVIKHIKLKV